MATAAVLGGGVASSAAPSMRCSCSSGAGGGLFAAEAGSSYVGSTAPISRLRLSSSAPSSPRSSSSPHPFMGPAGSQFGSPFRALRRSSSLQMQRLAPKGPLPSSSRAGSLAIRSVWKQDNPELIEGHTKPGQFVQALRSLPALVLGLGVTLSLRPGHALADVATEAFSPQGKGLLASAWAGLVAGCLHTLTGPDHLAALAPLCIGRSRLQSAAVGALWGCGHDAGQIIFGLIFLVLKDKLQIELIRTWASRVVGLTLITIGGVGIYESQEPVEVLAEASGLQDGGDSQVRVKNDSKNATTFATGVVYGLQPDALLMILPALALPSRATGAAFLIMFLLGTVLAMGSYTLFISTCSHALQKRLPGITKNLTIASSIIAIALGVALVASELFGLSIF